MSAGVPFIGKSGELLEELLGQVGLGRPDVYIDNALACMPPGIDLDLFLRNVRREAKEEGLDYVSPIDCCRPRLLREMGARRCLKCDLFELGAQRCSCVEPRWSLWAHRTMPKCVVPMGNASLLSLIGVAGITKRRGAPWEPKHGEAH